LRSISLPDLPQSRGFSAIFRRKTKAWTTSYNCNKSKVVLQMCVL